jgi:hypothetical protein
MMTSDTLMVSCTCGCGRMIPAVNKWGRPRPFAFDRSLAINPRNTFALYNKAYGNGKQGHLLL